ncbi:hypothetical protein RI103_26185 [Paraburkholderia sp. FT54]|uniref:hypothetical protein n=1 Tax=Paraburkholderia sp. FT54 TaxID=3074437 RepID=UPI0028776D15|nr:hypothetical protein [Paraburkholderia sp. FT54]WNC91789.1 hypothetical protein RI103_26185 [Paraburkholderia sp. FT54]
MRDFNNSFAVPDIEQREIYLGLLNISPCRLAYLLQTAAQLTGLQGQALAAGQSKQ